MKAPEKCSFLFPLGTPLVGGNWGEDCFGCDILLLECSPEEGSPGFGNYVTSALGQDCLIDGRIDFIFYRAFYALGCACAFACLLLVYCFTGVFECFYGFELPLLDQSIKHCKQEPICFRLPSY